MWFAHLADTLTRRARLVVALALATLVVAGAVGADVADSLTSGGFEARDAEATRAANALDEVFGAGAPNLVLLVTPAHPGTSLEAPAVAAAGMALTEELAAEAHVSGVASYWSLGSPPPLAADDGSSALVLARIEGEDDEVDERAGELSQAYTRDGVTRGETIDVAVGGQAEVFRQVGETIESDLELAEAIAFPITLVLLVLVFRSVVAAALPLGVGVFAILGTFLVLDVLASFTEVSVYALNLTTALGLGLAIDYALFVVTRYREERATGLATRPAIVRTVMTAGRAVVLSGLTVAAAMAALLVFPLPFLRSFAYAGIPVVLLAVTGAVVVLPAVLALLGDRIDRGRVGPRPPATGDDGEARFWDRTARLVMRRPVPVATAAIALLLVLGVPFLRIAFGLPDDRVLPEDTTSRQVSEVIRQDYSSREAGAVEVVLLADAAQDGAAMDGAAMDGAAMDDAVRAYAALLSTLEGVARVDAATGVYIDGVAVLEEVPGGERFRNDAGQWLSVIPAVEPASPDGEALVATVRAVDAPVPPGTEVLVGGVSADLVDSKEVLVDRLPVALALVTGVIFVLLFLSFGSLLVPVKALMLNLLSLTATFGAMVWIFQEGNLADTLDFTATGQLDMTMPILMFCVAFGLSMDYEVFLLSRIREEYDRTGDNTHAVATGLARTGRIVSAAALLISVVFLAFATSGISFIKLFGIGLTLAVLMDATVVRAFLVPAFMRLAGDANWWAPRWMLWIYDRAGLSEAAAEAAADRVLAPAGGAVAAVPTTTVPTTTVPRPPPSRPPPPP